MMIFNFVFHLIPFDYFYFTTHVNVSSVGFDGFNEYIVNAFSPDGRWSEAIETSSLIYT